MFLLFFPHLAFPSLGPRVHAINLRFFIPSSLEKKQKNKPIPGRSHNWASCPLQLPRPVQFSHTSSTNVLSSPHQSSLPFHLHPPPKLYSASTGNLIPSPVTIYFPSQPPPFSHPFHTSHLQTSSPPFTPLIDMLHLRHNHPFFTPLFLITSTIFAPLSYASTTTTRFLSPFSHHHHLFPLLFHLRHSQPIFLPVVIPPSLLIPVLQPHGLTLSTYAPNQPIS